MIKQYEGADVYTITLVSGKVLTLTEDELKEIQEDGELVENFKEQIKKIEQEYKYEIECTESDLRLAKNEIKMRKRKAKQGYNGFIVSIEIFLKVLKKILKDVKKK